MVQIKFTTFGASSAIGSFAPGDLLRCSEATARHLVDEAKCAKYVGASPQQETERPEEEAPKRSRKAK
jgi:hypothetical protein